MTVVPDETMALLPPWRLNANTAVSPDRLIVSEPWDSRPRAAQKKLDSPR